MLKEHGQLRNHIFFDHSEEKNMRRAKEKTFNIKINNAKKYKIFYSKKIFQIFIPKNIIQIKIDENMASRVTSV